MKRLGALWTGAVAYVALLLGAGLSIVFNVVDVMEKRGAALDRWDVLTAVAFPILVVLMVEMFVSRLWVGQPWPMQWLRWAGTISIGGIAMRVSWTHGNEFFQSREQTRDVAALGPLAVDLLAIMATALILSGRSPRAATATDAATATATDAATATDGHGHGHAATDGHGHGHAATDGHGHGHAATDGHGHGHGHGHAATETATATDGHGHAATDGHGHAATDDHAAMTIDERRRSLGHAATATRPELTAIEWPDLGTVTDDRGQRPLAATINGHAATATWDRTATANGHAATRSRPPAATAKRPRPTGAATRPPAATATAKADLAAAIKNGVAVTAAIKSVAAGHGIPIRTVRRWAKEIGS